MMQNQSKIIYNDNIDTENIEITCEVFEKISVIVNVLENNGFNHVEDFILDDIYMNNTNTQEFVPKNGKFTDSLIIRYVNENDQKIICKRYTYNQQGYEINTKKSVLKIENIKDAENHLNMLGYTRFFKMSYKNYMYENDTYIAYIQEVENLGIFLELEIKNFNSKEQNIDELIKFTKSLNLKIGTKFDIRKIELLYQKMKK